jgi:hypothetical protein
MNDRFYPRAPTPCWSFRVPLRAQPSYTAGARQPLIDIFFALQSLDVMGFGPWTFGHDLPVAFCNPKHFEGHAGRFFHMLICDLFGISCQAEY